MPTVTETLCTRCGLCCDGTLFGDVELTGRREAAQLEALGLDVDADDADIELLALPCAGLRGTRCSVYAHRPRCCRTFECRLLQETQRGLVTVDDALTRIAAARTQVQTVTRLVRDLEPRGAARLPLAERVADALAAVPELSGHAGRQRAALLAAHEALARTIASTFLD